MVCEKETRLPLSEQVEVDEMARIQCNGCDYSYELQANPNVVEVRRNGQLVRKSDVLRAVLTCAKCDQKTMFELQGDAITFAPGRLFEEDLSPSVGAEVQRLFKEGLLCFYGQSGPGTVAMCRSAVEEMLDTKGARGRDLNEKITDAKDRLGILGDEQVAQAQTARLIGRDALHRGRQVTQSQATVSLQATMELLNHISKQTPARQ